MRVVHILLAALSLRLCGADAPTPPAAPDGARIAGWIAQLGDASFVTRKAAEEELARAGEAAQKGLESAVQCEDAEVRERAERLLSRVRVGQILKRLDAPAPNPQSLEADLKVFGKASSGDYEISVSGHFKVQPESRFRMMKMQWKNGDGTAIPWNVVDDGTSVWSEFGDPPSKTVQRFSLKTIEEHRTRLGLDFVDRYLAMERPTEQLKELRKRFDFTDGKDGTLDGVEVHVLAGERSAGADAATPLMRPSVLFARIYVDKSTAVVRKVEMYNAQHEVVMRYELSNIKLGQKFEKSDFTYTPPPGVAVTDMDELARKNEKVIEAEAARDKKELEEEAAAKRKDK